jgi:hypothetical protein
MVERVMILRKHEGRRMNQRRILMMKTRRRGRHICRYRMKQRQI